MNGLAHNIRLDAAVNTGSTILYASNCRQAKPHSVDFSGSDEVNFITPRPVVPLQYPLSSVIELDFVQRSADRGYGWSGPHVCFGGNFV